ncbi:MAG TPA: hypothetical protein VFE62_06675 [Gemmataceae bacterium]|nr:hypothetical protein [Gemmataceae bacterium]
MHVVELAKGANFALTVSLEPESSAALAKTLPEVKSALLDWMEKRHNRCAEVILTVTIASSGQDDVEQQINDTLEGDADLAPLLKRASVQIALLDEDGTPIKEYELTAKGSNSVKDGSTAIQTAGPTALAAGNAKPPPVRRAGEANRRDRKETDSASSSVVMVVVLLLAIPFVLLVCIGMAGLGLGFLWVAPGPRMEVQPPMAVEQAMPGQDIAVVAQPIVPPQAPPDVPGKKTIDLIPLIDTQRDAVENRKWSVRNNTLYCDDGNFVPRLQIPYRPPQEYDFTVVFSQPGLRNGISLIMPNPNGGSFFWYLGAGDGSTYGFHGNPDKGGQVPGLVQANVPCTTTVQVRKNSVKGFVNGKEMIGFNTDYRDLLCDGWRNIPDKSVLAVACDDPAVFHFVRVVEITGQGKRTR